MGLLIASSKQILGSGLYSVAEAALYARVSTPMMSRWLFGSKSGSPVIEPQYGRNDERHVSFLDLVQTLAVREIRIQRKVPLVKFRQAIELARTHFSLDYPFARQHCTYLLNDELVIRPQPDKDDFIEASGRHRGQRLIPFVEMYLKDLSFNIEGLANSYLIYKSGHENPVKVTMDPQHRFGEPLLPSGYSALTIWDAIRAEGGIRQASDAYGVPVEEVETAHRFVVDHLGKTAA